MPDLDESNLAALLLQHWDVLGVADADVMPEAEYRHEAAQVWRLLGGGADVEDLARCLTAAAEQLGAAKDLRRDRRAAQAMVDAYIR